MIISAYTPQVVTSRAKPFEYNFELITNVLAARQASYNKAFEGIKNLRKQALSIRFLNESAQSEIDQKNNQINDYFNSLNNEFGDLAEPQVAQRYTELFKSIASDRDLINQYQKDLKLQTELSNIEAMRKSADPVKAGFHPINYSNYLYDVNKYTKSNFRTDKVEVDPYVPYIDMNKEMAVIARGIPISKTQEQRLTPDGYVETITREGRDPVSVFNASQQYLESKGSAQVRQQAKYYYRETIKDDDDKLYLYNQYNNTITTQISRLEEQKKKAEPNQISMLDNQIASLKSRQYSPQEYLALDESDYIDHLTMIETQETLSNFTETYGRQAISRTIDADKFALQANALENSLKLEAMKQGITGATGEDPLAGVSTAITDSPIAIKLPQTMEAIRTNLQQIYTQTSNVYDNTSFDRAYMNYLASNRTPDSYVPDGQTKAVNLTNTLFFRAFQKGVDQLKRTEPGLSNEQLLEKAKAYAKETFTTPKTAEQVALYNEQRETRARAESLGDLMEQATASGNPAKFFEDQNLTVWFANYKTIVDPSNWQSSAQKSTVVNYRNEVANRINSQIAVNAANEEKGGAENLLGSIPAEYITVIDKHIDGTVQITLDPKAFQGTEDKPAPLAGKYIGYYENGRVVHTDVTQTMTFKIPEFDVLQLQKTLPLYIGNTPLQFYGTNKANQSVPFFVQRTSDGGLYYKIGEGEYKSVRAGVDPTTLINQIKQTISAS